MSASAAASAPHSALGPPLRLGWTILHLALLGSVGFAILIGWMILVATGPVLIVLFGAGLLILLAMLYVLFGLARFEIGRVGSWTISCRPVRRRSTRSSARSAPAA